jgi:UDP-N-acetylmuramate--alanine ligase
MKYKKIYFMGIGGIGMSALARYYNKRGTSIYGYDKTETELTKKLEAEHMHIHYEDRIDLIPDNPDLIVITPAVPNDLNEYQFLKQQNFPMLKRSTVLGSITSDKKNIAVAGTHGKTTTSALLAHLLYDAGIELTAFLGGIAVNYQTNFLDSGDDWMIEEADEYDRSFLALHPDLAIIGSLDADHLDIYGSREEMRKNYLQFAQQIKKNGLLLMSDTIAGDDILYFQNNLTDTRIESFGFEDSVIHVNITGSNKGWTTFHYNYKNESIPDLTLRMPGQHNIRNAAASIRIARELGVEVEQIRKSLINFKGIKRRYEWIRESANRVLIDDYAHHPEELRAAINASRDCFPGRKITGIFQPHLYSRTRDFMNEFAEVLGMLDEVIVVEIYPARENPITGISSETLYSKLRSMPKWVCSKKELCPLLKTLDLDVVITLGAGDLDMMMDEIEESVFLNEITNSADVQSELNSI